MATSTGRLFSPEEQLAEVHPTVQATKPDAGRQPDEGEEVHAWNVIHVHYGDILVPEIMQQIWTC